MVIKKYYVVWKWRKQGVFDNRETTKASVDGFAGAEYKSFLTQREAEQAFAWSYQDYKGLNTTGTILSAAERLAYGDVELNSICVDAACSGNPGILEYRGVATQTRTEIFRYGPYQDGTTNIGEFLALVAGLAYLSKQKTCKTLYSDSKIAIWRVRKGSCRTQLPKTAKNAWLFQHIAKAEEWLASHDTSHIDIRKWHTKAWGEIPADFGRK